MKKKIGIFLILLIIMLGAFYIMVAVRYQRHFMPNSWIGPYDVSDLTDADAVELIRNGEISHYHLSIVLKDKTASIQGSDIDLSLSTNVSDYIKLQPSERWIFDYNKKKDYNLKYDITYDESKLASKIKSIPELNEQNMKHPKDAYLTDYVSGEGFTIIPETEGSWIDVNSAIYYANDAVKNLKTNINAEELSLYETAKITREDPDLIKERDRKNAAFQAVIVYDFGSEQITLDADTYHDWITFTEEGFNIDEEKASEYVEGLVKETDTAYTTRDFVTSNGSTVQVTGPYGYRMAPNDERTQLLDDIYNGRQVNRKPVYTREGATRDGNDYGNTYVEVDLTGQKVYLYVNGVLIKSSDCVTGKVSNGNATPPGIYPMTYKQKDAVLRGPGYASPVKFWMPFNGGIGLHDASWRATFGGTIYKNNGSHGCVNLPYDMAKTIYENAYTGMPVICY